MNWLQNIYSLSLKLYPRSFQKRFGEEMKNVFSTGLVAARKRGGLLGFLMRELTRLPGSLVSVYVWSMQEGQGRPAAVSNVIGAGTAGVNLPGSGWGSSFLAGLPHLLMGIFIISTIAASQAFFPLYFIVAIFSITLLGVIIYSFAKGWKTWSASWILYILFVFIILLNYTMHSVYKYIEGENYWLYSLAGVLIIPLTLAYLLYKIASKDRLRGLLAAIPLIVVLWIFFLELVPALHQSFAWGWIFLLAFLASVFMLQTKHFLSALGLAIAVPLLGGLPFAYLGVFQGGTLPFSEPGPSLAEAFRQYLPVLAAILIILLGPQLATKLRSIGNALAANGGKIFYRITLGGVVLGLIGALLQWETVTSGTHIKASIVQLILISGVILYLAGFGLLSWASNREKSPSGDKSTLLELGALFLPLLFVPGGLFLVYPILTGHITYGWLLPLGELAWVFASILIVKD
jgi:hypothetical protein